MHRRRHRPASPPSVSIIGCAFLLIPFLSACGIMDLGDDPQREPRAGETTVLFIGSSYLEFNDVPQRFKELSRKAGHDVFVKGYTFLGQPLSFFAASSGAATIIRERDWDFVILQGGAQNVAYPRLSAHPAYPALRELHRKATEDSPGTRVVYMMPWAYEDGMLWAEGHTETYEEMQLDIRENVLDWSDELGLAVAPVGMAFYQVLTTWNQGLHFLHDSDWNHASQAGSYLAAATFFSTIFVESCSDVDYDWKVEKGLAKELRDVASSTVLGELGLWNIDWGGSG